VPAKENPSLGRLILLRLFFSFEDFQLCERACSLAFTLRKEGQVELFGETPKQLGAARSCQASPDSVNTYFFSRSNGPELPFPIAKTQPAFHPHAQRNAFRRMMLRDQVINSALLEAIDLSGRF
jgi:hypothetical protein